MGMSLCSPLKFGIYDISYTIFYAKFIYILCKFYPVRSFDYSWNNNLIMFLYERNICFILENLIFFLLLSHFLVNINTTNINKVVSMLFSQCRGNADEHMLTQLSFSTKNQCWNNIVWSTLNRLNSLKVVLPT